jgi:2-phospho-L-lactate/phosphoenolpyruvate guanylyltransferase
MSAPARLVWGVVLAKAFESAKSRLATVVTPEERERLARSMFEHVISVLREAPGLEGVLVVTDSARVGDAAERAGVRAVHDPAGASGLADCVDHGLDEVRRRGGEAAVVLVSDLPEVTVHDVARLVDALNHFDVAIARDRGGEHTNALALRLETRFHTSFGAADSFHRHCESARRTGLSLTVLESPSLAFDVDTPEDYARLNRNLGSRVNLS